MLRGVITITTEEAKEALTLLPEEQEDRPIHHKLVAAVNNGNGELELQVSEEELEMIIDNMGPPTSEDSVAKKGLRTKLQNFLVELKS